MNWISQKLMNIFIRSCKSDINAAKVVILLFLSQLSFANSVPTDCEKYKKSLKSYDGHLQNKTFHSSCISVHTQRSTKLTYCAPERKAKLYRSLISPKEPHPNEHVNVKAYGAKGDGINDDTQAFQRAIDYASKTQLKLVVIPKGCYIITQTVIIRKGVTLQGSPKMPFKAAFSMDFALISIKSSGKNISLPCFVVEMGSGIKGLSFYWPEQSKNSLDPIKYGWAISTTGKQSEADNIQIEDIMLTNCYNGIKVENGGQMLLRNIFGQTLNVGIVLNKIYDVSRLENIHFWDFWATEGTKSKNYIQQNGQAIVVGRVDGLQGTNLFAYGHKNILHFVDFGDGSAWGQFNNVTADVCYSPIQIDKVNLIQLYNVNGTIWDKKTGKNFIETGEKVDGEINITNLNTYLAQTAINISSSNGTFKLSNIIARKRGIDHFDIFQYKVINQSTANVYIDEADFNEIAGVVQIGPTIKFSADKEITSELVNFSQPDKWSLNSGRVLPIPGGSRFLLKGGIETVRLPVPQNLSDQAGIFIVECDIQLREGNNLNADGQFYLRLTNFTVNDVILPGNPLHGFFVEKTHLKIPFIIRKSGLFLDFVFGNNSNANFCAIDITNLKLFKMDKYKYTQTMIDWIHTKQPNSLKLELPSTLKR